MAAQAYLTYAALRAGPLNKTALSGKYGTAWQRVMGGQQDNELNRLSWARRSRWPDWAPGDALLYIGAERLLEQVRLMGTGGKRENTNDYRTRLRTAWSIWQEGGSAESHIDAFRWTGLSDVAVFRRKELPPPPLNASFPSQYVQAFQQSVWSQFDILVGQPHPWKPYYWGAGGLTWGAWSWGSNADPLDIAQLVRLARRFRSGHDTPTWIRVRLLGGPHYWGSWVWGSGSFWGDGIFVNWLVGEPHWTTRGLA